jgi:hypothetical protein
MLYNDKIKYFFADIFIVYILIMLDLAFISCVLY